MLKEHCRDHSKRIRDRLQVPVFYEGQVYVGSAETERLTGIPRWKLYNWCLSTKGENVPLIGLYGVRFIRKGLAAGDKRAALYFLLSSLPREL